MPRVGIVGSLVWDEIHGRNPLEPPVEEWGGIAYALAGLDAALPPEWTIVPLIKVGSDLEAPAAEFLGSLARLEPGARAVGVPVPNNRVVLRYTSGERRCERMSGGVPGWTWPELGPMVGDLDALYVNFISGFEMDLGTAESLRQGFGGPIYADLHSLFLGMQADGTRRLRPLPEAPGWFGCFDVLQMNEDEMGQLGENPLVVAADALGAGASALLVTLGPAGTAWVAQPGFHALTDRGRGASPGAPVRTARVPAEAVDALDPTGCGDVFGAVTCARLLAGDALEEAVATGNRQAARNATFRGARGLATHLRGELLRQ